MNSIERKEARYKRRKNKRLEKIRNRSNKYADLDKVFCFSKAMYYGDKCCKGVGYKKSTQNFKLHLFTIISSVCANIKSNNYIVGDTYSFIINERGKTRKIDAPHIKDRLVHKILSNEIIEPLYSIHLIYDNGASTKNKGFKFSMDRIKKKLYSWYLKYGLKGYIVLLDFSKFFENCSHDVIRNIHNKYIINKSYIKRLDRSFIYCKWKYKLYETGKIICKPCINTIKRQKLKLKKMLKLNLSIEEIENTKRSFNTDLSLSKY